MDLETERSFDEVLEKYYNPVAAPEDRVYIQAMANHLQRILNWDPGEEDNLFDKQRGPDIIRDILTNFAIWKANVAESHQQAEVVGIQHLVVYSLAKLCLFYWIKDSTIVAEVLRHVFNCDGHFSSMFAHIVSQYDRTVIWPSANPEVRDKEHLTMLFFLCHAHNAQVLFHGVRFVDTRLRVPIRVSPVFLAAIYNKPRLLLLLLRYGALLDRRWAGGLSDDWDLPMLMRHLTRILWASRSTEPQEDRWESAIISSTLYSVSECLRFVLRAIRQIDFGELDVTLMNFDANGVMVSSNSHEFIRIISEKGIVPKLASRYMEPSELQHLCRCCIRQSLNKNWALPFGVFQLPLPTAIQKYLNLCED